MAKRAIVTGASSGLGRVLARDLAREGWNLVVAARRLELLTELVEELRQLGVQARAIQADVSRIEDCRTLVREGVAFLGGLDALVLNAGVSMWARFEDISDVAVFERVMRTNYLGAVYCIHAAIPHLVESGGLIVTVTSAQAVLGMPHHTGYSASKHALKGFLEALEFELDGRVRILNVMPGWIRGTDLRANAFVGDGTETGSTRKHSDESVSAEECSQAVLKAMRSGRRELYIPSKLRTIPWLKLFARGWLRRKIRRAVAAQPESQRRVRIGRKGVSKGNQEAS